MKSLELLVHVFEVQILIDNEWKTLSDKINSTVRSIRKKVRYYI